MSRFKANSKKIEGRLLFFFYIFYSPHSHLPPSLWSVAAGARRLEEQFHLIRQIKQKTKPSRMRNVRFGRGDLAVRRNGLGLKVACPAQRGWNLKGRCLLLWPFYSVIRWRRRTAACAPDALRASAAASRQTVRSQQVLPRLCVRVLVCAAVRALNCASVCARMARERETGGRREGGGAHRGADIKRNS